MPQEMKNPGHITRLFLGLTAFTSFLCSILICCNNSAPKTESIENTPNDTIRKVDTTGYVKDMDSYKKSMSDTMSAFDKRIADYKSKIDQEGKKVKVDYKKEIANLDTEKKDLQIKLDNYQAKGKVEWDKFKVDFSRDVDTLGKQIKQLTSSKK
jgi:hypothetical protein